MTNPSTADSTPPSAPGLPGPVFVTTHWSVVAAAGRCDSQEARAALSELCQAYWYPLYAHVRRRGHSPADAQDLTQSFFARLIEKNWLADADRDRGRFRSFLLASLNHFLANEWHKARAEKRGGGRIHPLEIGDAEERYQHEPADEATPDRAFDRRWALALLDRVLARLRDDYVSGGKGPLFEQIRSALGGGRSEIPYAQLGAPLGLSEGAVKVAVHRLRQRYRELLRAEIAQTVEGPEQVEEELRHLFAALGS